MPTATRTPVTSFRLAPVWPNVQMWALKSEFSGRMTALPYRLDVIQSERLTGRFDGICLVPGLRCGPDDPRPYIPNGFTQTGEPAGKLDPDAPLSGLVLLDVDRKQDGDTPVPPHLLDHPHVAAWGYSKTGTGCHILIWVPKLAGLPAGSGKHTAYRQAWTQTAAWLKSETGLTADDGRADASGLMRQSSNPLHVNDNPEPFPLARLEPPSTVEPRPQTTLHRALTVDPTLWGRVGKLAGYPNLHEGDQPCPRPDHTHTSNSTLGIGEGNVWIHRSGSHPEVTGGDAVRLVWFLQGNDTKPVGDDYRNLEVAIQDALGLGMTAVDPTVDTDGEGAPDPVEVTLTATNHPDILIANSSIPPIPISARTGREIGEHSPKQIKPVFQARTIELATIPPEELVLVESTDPAPAETELLHPAYGPPITTDPAQPTVIGGPPKAGKSWWGLRIAHGFPHLRTVIISGEGSGIWHRRAAAHKTPIGIMPIPTPAQDEQAAALLADADIVIIDPLARWYGRRGIDPNDPGAVDRELDRIAELTQTATVLIHHIRKTVYTGPGQTDPTETLRGSGALAATAGAIYLAEPARWGGFRRSVLAQAAIRDGETDTGGWALKLGTLQIERRNTDQMNGGRIGRIVEAVTDHWEDTGDPCPISSIKGITPAPTRQELKRLVRDGHLTEGSAYNKRPRYLPPSSPSSSDLSSPLKGDDVNRKQGPTEVDNSLWFRDLPGDAK